MPPIASRQEIAALQEVCSNRGWQAKKPWTLPASLSILTACHQSAVRGEALAQDKGGGVKRLQRLLRRPVLVQGVLFCLLLALSAAAFWLATSRATRLAETGIRNSAEDTLRLQAEAIVSQLDKHRFVPAVLAKRREIISLASLNPALPQDPGLKSVLEDTTWLSGSLDIAVASPDGRILAGVTGLVTETIADLRGLRIPSAQGRLGRSSVKLANGKRAYGFSSSIRIANRHAGSVIVLAPVEAIERSWTLSGKPVFATDNRLEVVARDLQASQLASDDELMTLLAPASLAGRIERAGERYALFTRPINPVGWRLHVLENLRPIGEAWNQAALISLLGSALLVVASMWLANRWLTRSRQARMERANAIRLERTVRERTRELSRANERLRQTQRELVQAGKLAGLGQMSAALSHEFNQPLAAIRSYADNAAQYLQRGRTGEAEDNITRIAALTARMAAISKDLQNFARRPQERTSAVDLREVVDGALELVAGRVAESGVTVKTELPGQPLLVRAGVNRLQQVVINLLTNALDAMAQSAGKPARDQTRKPSHARRPAPDLKITASSQRNKVILKIRDCGPGFSKDVAEKMFDPFYTTKGVNEGLGLGLSISYNIIRDFAGKLMARNHPAGGAEFIIELEPWREEETPLEPRDNVRSGRQDTVAAQ